MNLTYQPKPNQGAIFLDQKRENPDAPNLRGDLYLDRQLLADLLEQPDELVKVQIASWERVSKNNHKYFTLLASKPFVKDPS